MHYENALQTVISNSLFFDRNKTIPFGCQTSVLLTSKTQFPKQRWKFFLKIYLSLLKRERECAQEVGAEEKIERL